MDRLTKQQRDAERERKTFGYATALGEAMRLAQAKVSTKPPEARHAPHTVAETAPQGESVFGETAR
jgi:hypothetical protein